MFVGELLCWCLIDTVLKKRPASYKHALLQVQTMYTRQQLVA